MAKTFGQYIAELRTKHSMSQRRLADLAGVTNSTISRIEADIVKPDLNTLKKIASALNVEQSILLNKFGNSEIPEDFVIIARKAGELPEDKRQEAYKIFNETIDKFLELVDNEDDD